MSHPTRLALLGLFCAPCFAAQSVALHQAPATVLDEFHVNNTLRTASAQPQEKQLVKRSTGTGKGYTQYQQYYYGFPVVGGEVTKRESDTPTVSGQLYHSIELKPDYLMALANGPNPALALASAKKEFLEKHKGADWKFSNEHTELVVKMVNNVATPSMFVRFDAHAKGQSPIHFRGYVNAEAPFSTIHSWNNIQYFADVGPGGNDRTGFYQYDGKTMPSLNVTRQGSECLMLNMTNQIFLIVDMRGHIDEPELEIPYINPFSYRCGDPNRDNEPYFGAGSPDDDAFQATQMMLDMYRDWFNDRPLQGDVIVRTHYSLPFWGSFPMANAFYEPEWKTLNIGDGSEPLMQQIHDAMAFYPLTSPDVIAHEFGHGYTDEHSGLVYAEQSGSLNESFSDMSGITMMEYIRQKNPKMYQKIYHSTNLIWSMGASIMRTSDPNAALRYMDQPSKDGMSADCLTKSAVSDGSCKIDYDDVVTFAQATTDDPEEQQGIIVHLASGIFNHWFYALANTRNWGVKRAYTLAMKANSQGYWQPNTDYQQAACATLEAAGTNATDRSDVIQAFNKVGINMESCSQ